MSANTVREFSGDSAAEIFGEGLKLVDFWAPWCGPCRMMHPVLEEVASRQDAAAIVKVNVDENQDLASSFGVSAIPLLVLMRDGKEVTRFVGVQQVGKLVKAIESASTAKA